MKQIFCAPGRALWSCGHQLSTDRSNSLAASRLLLDALVHANNSDTGPGGVAFSVVRRPASDFSIDGSSWDGATLPGPCAVNCTNGEDFGTTTFPHPYYGAQGTSEVYAFHPAGANVAFGDGSVQFIGKKIDIRVFARLVTRDKAEALSREDLGF